MTKPFFLAAILLLAVAGGTAAQASEHGCRVLLCLANPSSNGGPRGVAECVPTINKLYDDLSKGHSFPTCDLADGNDGRSYARHVYDPYDPCPQGTRPAATDVFLVQGTLTNATPRNVSHGNGSGNFSVVGQPAMSQQQTRKGHWGAPRACVGTQIGQYHYGGQDDGYDVLVFDRVVWQQPQSPAGIDIWVDGQFQQRVRY